MDLSMGQLSANLTDRRPVIPAYDGEQARANATLGALMGAYAGTYRPLRVQPVPYPFNESMADIAARIEANRNRIPGT